jgi:hypothetical protein
VRHHVNVLRRANVFKPLVGLLNQRSASPEDVDELFGFLPTRLIGQKRAPIPPAMMMQNGYGVIEWFLVSGSWFLVPGSWFLVL